MPILDSRELALLICLSAVAVLVAARSKKGAIRNFLAILVVRPLLLLWLSLLTYVAACVLLLWSVGLWNPPLLKATVFWLSGVALVALFEVLGKDGEQFPLRSLVTESVGVGAIFAFIASSHTFNLGGELLLASVATIATIMHVASQRKPASVQHRISSVVLVGLGLLVVGHSLRWIVVDPGAFLSVSTASELLVLTALTLLYLPFLFSLHTMMAYERALSVARRRASARLPQWWVFAKLFRSFRTDVRAVDRWRRHIGVFPLDTREVVDASIKEVRRGRRREERPYRVPPAVGWLPEDARKFLQSLGLVANDYHRTPNGWWAASPIRELSDSVLANSLAYYIEGDEHVVWQLKIKLNVYEPKQAQDALASFNEAVAQLISSSVRGHLRGVAEVELTPEREVPLGPYIGLLTHTAWVGGVPDGYDLVFTIRGVPESGGDVVDAMGE